MKSSCCHADVKKSNSIEYFHGADDDYELKIPVFNCSKCGKQEIPTVITETVKIYKAS
ncbi:hypothetical protein ACFYKX_13085 [Cytobacillus sp. FJAT-54145]|uniref:YgiT-type zinc finger protein n=1 Tax=Cytobacillus spartinae TaxID=3299023 RepID=A0ABW6KBH2_9BACI